MADFSENISNFRASIGLSRAAFGEALGVKPDKIKHIETGFQRADHEFLASLREKFGVDLNEMINGNVSGLASRAQSEGAIFSHASTAFTPIPQYKIEASAGHGSLVQDKAHDSTYAYSRAFLERRGLKPDKLAVISVRGDSMAPDLYDGDKILVDCASVDPGQIKDGQIYVVTVDGALYVKRIQHLPQHRLVLSSSNPVYQPIVVEAADMNSVRLIGRVVSSSHEW